ncbi:ciliary microtubule inner protein 4 isoform X2 [Dendrobates tinctorius]|uniref:ciliary microtubule inner protein 4 isoform X2 n=1 Tax=Dendrobates tinctorius TaxID=92724 RepID=UPI003CC946EB
MEAKSSVIKCNPSLPPLRSVSSHTVHHKKKKLQMSSANSYHANPQTTSSQNGNLDKRSNTSPAHIKNCEELTRSLVPANIRHKYGSHVVDQLISPEQVRSSLSKARTQCHQDYYIPRLRMETYFMEDYPHKIYYELGHCLRSNLFPGAPIKQNSLVHDSYTAEVNEKGRLEKHNNHHWHGRKTDDLANWSAMLLKTEAIAKIVQNQPKPAHTFLLPTRTKVPKDVPPPPPPVQPLKKPRKQRHQDKSKKPEVQPPPVSPPKEEDDFWDFYDKSI